MYPTPKPGTLLHCEDGTALVVSRGISKLDAMHQMVEEAYGGKFAPTNPVLAREAERVQFHTWHSCTKAFSEENGLEDNWWHSDGDGKRFIDVAYYESNIHDLGDEAVAAEEVPVG